MASNITEQVKEQPQPMQVPYNIDAEQYVLGGLLLNNQMLDRVGDFLLAEHFYEPVHQRIFDAIVKTIDKGIIANPVTLKNHFAKDSALEELGGNNYLMQLTSYASGVFGIKDYAVIVYNLYVSRKLIEISEETIEDCLKVNGSEGAASQIELPESKLFALSSEGTVSKGFDSINISVRESIAAAELASKDSSAISGIKTQFSDIDSLLGGLNKSDLIILAARPSMGKTALSLNYTVNAAEYLLEKYKKELQAYNELGADKNPNDEPKLGCVGFMSLEMSSEQLATRMLSMETGISANHIRRGKLSKSPDNNEFAKLVRAGQKINSLPIFIDDTPALTISAVRTRARRLKRKHNLELLIVDYLQLLRGVGRKSTDSRVQEISEISMGLKAIAKELNIPVLALSQLSRAVETRSDKRPQLSDLRESGSIEQDADIVKFIFREAYYKEREKPSESDTEKMAKWMEEMSKIDSLTEIIVAKNRHGPISNVTLFFDKNTTKFKDYTHQSYSYE